MKPSYQQPDRGWCGDPSRGAAMGRGSDLPFDFKGALQIRHVPLDGDYDPGGTYWGGPDNLYCAVSTDGRERYLRIGHPNGVTDIEAAKAQFPNATFPVQSEVSDADIDDMLAGYIEAALFSTNDESTPEGGEPLDNNYNESDLTPECRAGMREDCERFAHENSKALLASMGKKGAHTVKWASWDLAGYLIWLNRNGHGIGFWGGEWPEPYDKALDDACSHRASPERPARGFGEVYLYVTDDGKIGMG